jgi:hypothetical protein
MYRVVKSFWKTWKTHRRIHRRHQLKFLGLQKKLSISWHFRFNVATKEKNPPAFSKLGNKFMASFLMELQEQGGDVFRFLSGFF